MILTRSPAPTTRPMVKLGTKQATTIMQLSTTAMELKRTMEAYKKWKKPGWNFTRLYVMAAELIDITTRNGNDEMKFERMNTPKP